MLTIIRVAFWVFIFTQVCLLLFSSEVRRKISAKYLHWSFGIKIGIVVAYFVCTCPEIGFYSDWFLRFIGMLFLIGLLFLVWRGYLPKSLSKDKVYTLTDLSDLKSADAQNALQPVLGNINEGKISFSACLYLKEEDFMRLHAQGFFDDHSHKTLYVKIIDSRPAQSSDENTDVIVALA